jgi:hypothetical protein
MKPVMNDKIFEILKKKIPSIHLLSSGVLPSSSLSLCLQKRIERKQKKTAFIKDKEILIKKKVSSSGDVILVLLVCHVEGI